MADNHTPYHQQQNANAFLKNLSQKKYAWMEEAIASTPPASLPPPPPSSSTDTHKRQKKQKISESPSEQARKITPIRPKKPTTPVKPTPSSDDPADPPKPSSPQLTVKKEEEEEEQSEQDETQRRHLPQPRFKYTTFPVKGYNILPTRNITSTFARNDTSYFTGQKAGSKDIAPDPEEEWRDTVVIHPGSRNLRIGLASEAFPISVPHVIARRQNQPPAQQDSLTPPADQEKREAALRDIRNELKWRMKNAKRRVVPNAESQVIGFNATGYKETVLDHNDPYKVEWTDLSSRTDYFVGEKALNVPMAKDTPYYIRYPWKYGTLNNQDYSSMQAVLNDLEIIWTESIVDLLEIDKAAMKHCCAVLVVPDMLDHHYVCAIVNMMLRFMEFKSVIVQQESTCATYGAGVSSAVVVDIGAQTTSITCIEDGVCQTDSRMSIQLGGDDITKTFTDFLMANKFPYSDLNLHATYDWRLAETLKEKWCTLNEADISVQVYDFFKRTPFHPTLKYQCKVYDEVFLAPLCLVYPDILQKNQPPPQWTTQYVTDDVVEDTNLVKPNQAFDSYPLDVAIAQSITTGANGSEEKLKRYFTSIILVGGGGKVANFSKVLEDRVISTVIAQAANVDRVEVVPAPRELDPEVLVWKGATVMAKLDSAKDMWIGPKEWEEVGARCLRERALLM
ncbi:putative actin-related protein 8 [Choanephora cucurbitarum]|uniref:Putative actin-related protein 8 n=1 Tax=Choanephora cucurbitarum TaxID=101091 RepID=A0A1C7N1W3_9FUNG|nr:putative actin-related protein 8 [Choanephora cucurbitarum]